MSLQGFNFREFIRNSYPLYTIEDVTDKFVDQKEFMYNKITDTQGRRVFILRPSVACQVIIGVESLYFEVSGDGSISVI